MPYLANFPIALFQDLSLGPSKIFSKLRSSLKTISVKSKADILNLIVFDKTTNHDFHFMHTANNFIFLELPKYNTVLFYLINKEFKTEEEALSECKEIIEKVYYNMQLMNYKSLGRLNYDR